MTNAQPQDDYRDTVLLPVTSFPMRGNLPVREPEILKRWEQMGLDEKLAKAAEGKPLFTLHDGPPYANGHLHIGHALNKIVKDVINRAHRMSGYAVTYIPGWDCHGLPIEWKVEEQYRKAGRDKDSVPVLQFRAECRDYARQWLEVQSEEFRRLGVQGCWSERYATMDFSSEAAIVREIGKFLMNGSLYRGLRPVMWSPVEKTALAEAEVEYHDHTSTTLFVAFPIIHDPTPEHILAGVAAVIWTTTAWTIPVNRALAYGAGITYAVVEVREVEAEATLHPGDKLLVARDLVDGFCKGAGVSAYDIRHTLSGEGLAGAVAAHPLRGKGYDYDVPFLAGDFVTTEAGTGLVHLSPAHGEDDFALCQAHGIEVPELVMDDGRYAEWVPLFAGVHVFKATDPVKDALVEAIDAAHASGRPTAGFVASEVIVHSYPHSWRSRAPVIFRATPQWFIRLDGDTRIREKALRALDGVKFVPERARNRLTSMVANRPDWCISRQRSWGVPIAVFVERQTGEVLRDADVMGRVVEAFEQHGADAWYSLPASHFLGARYNPDDYEQVFDIVDVWFESGSTHAFVLGKENLAFPADLYLEGSDQHRGWFQSSLLESVGSRDQAPFKTIVTNGFVLDEQGRKMSKSLGNVIAPQDVNDTMGADILRLWVMNSDTNEDLRIGKEILKQQADLYRRIRNTLRWILGALDGFEPKEAVDFAKLPELERWVLHRVSEMNAIIARAVETHDWIGVYPALHGFCTSDLSAFYFDIRKDTLYCDAANSYRRRSVRTVLDILHRCLCTWFAPVLVFTAEEAWTTRFGQDDSVHLQSFYAVPQSWHDAELGSRWEILRNIRRAITTEIEAARREGAIGSSLQAAVELPLSAHEAALFGHYAWDELAIVSKVDVRVVEGAGSLYCASEGTDRAPHGPPVVRPAAGEKCARCWRVLDEVGTISHYPALCVRCADVVSA